MCECEYCEYDCKETDPFRCSCGGPPPPQDKRSRKGDSWKAKYYRQQDIILEETRQDEQWMEVVYGPDLKGPGLMTEPDLEEFFKHCKWIKYNVVEKDSITEQEHNDAIAHTEAMATLLNKYKEA